MENKNLLWVLENIKENETYINKDKTLALKSISMKYGVIKINHISQEIENLYLKKEYEFEKYKVPVTFEEVIKSNKRCRVEHELIDLKDMLCDIMPTTFMINWEKYCNGEYIELGILLSILGYMYKQSIHEIIKNGKWYLED